MILKFIRLDLPNNTIEATWFDNEGVSVRCHNYSVEQKSDFLAEVENGQQYADAMGW